MNPRNEEALTWLEEEKADIAVPAHGQTSSEAKALFWWVMTLGKKKKDFFTEKRKVDGRKPRLIIKTTLIKEQSFEEYKLEGRIKDNLI